MIKFKSLMSVLAGGASVIALSSNAWAENFNIPGGDLEGALKSYASQAGVRLVVSDQDVKGRRTKGAQGELTAVVALSRILDGTGFSQHATSSGAIVVTRQQQHSMREEGVVTSVAQAAPRMSAAAGIESVVVTSSKIKGDIQTVPIAITALSQEQLTERQIAGGPDLVKEVPNLTFSKTNFSGYNLQIRGIGTQAVSVTIDPAVAVAFNDTPFLRNHFFEQEFFDVSQVQVLRGPQGTLFGRNANAGVVNIESAKPGDRFEAMLSADWGNFSNRRYEGMINLPIVDDKMMLRVAGEWTKRDGYATNDLTGQQIDGRDLWSTRATLRWKPVETVTADFIWEHFQENDDRLRSGKQLCHTDPGPTSFTAADGTVVPLEPPRESVYKVGNSAVYSQGCLPGSLYDKGDPAHGDYGAFGAPNGFSLPFVTGAGFNGYWNQGADPYAQDFQSTDLRHIDSSVPSRYRANNDTLEFNAEWNITPALTFNSETGFNNDFLWSLEDFNRFESASGVFTPNWQGVIDANGVYCDPQLGCADRLVLEDLSTEHSWQLSQEFRLASNFSGPFNFSAGGNYLHYETVEKFYVFSNTFSMIAYNGDYCDPNPWQAGVSDGMTCLGNGRSYDTKLRGGLPSQYPTYLDPNPISSLNDNGRNYFLSKNPYILNSYALFGEAYYNITNELKLTGGIRWTDDEKHFPEFPSRTLDPGYGVQQTGIVYNGQLTDAIDQSWKKFSGRAVINWAPKLDFTDQTMVYASYSHGYKAGGANPPPAVLSANQGTAFPIHPLTFDPEYIDAFELGTKNTALDGGLTFNADVFYYDYKGYQISQIVDRTSVNINVDATVRGAEIQADWSPLPGLKFGFNGGYEDTRIKDNQYFIDLMDRTYGHHDTWTIMKPWPGEASNCIFPNYVAAALVQAWNGYGQGNPGALACGYAYTQHVDPNTLEPYTPNPVYPADYNVVSFFAGGNLVGKNYPGYDPISNDPLADPNTVNNGLGFAPNNGEGFQKPIGGNELPNAPHFTTSFTAQYTMPLSDNWAATLHSDFYWQSQSFARIFNDRPYDKIRGYSNANLALILNDATGWQVMGYVKNIFDTTAITGDFLYTDDVGLTTNIFLTDPRLYGVRVTKQFAGSGDDGGFDLFSNADGKSPQIWLTVGGNFNAKLTAAHDPYQPDYTRPGGTQNMTQAMIAAGFPAPSAYEKSPNSGLDWEDAISYQPAGSDWVLKAGIRYGRSSRNKFVHESKAPPSKTFISIYGAEYSCEFVGAYYGSEAEQSCRYGLVNSFIDAHNRESERHTIMDFTLGRDVGIGTVSAGLRVAQFGSLAHSDINTDSENHFVPDPFAKYHDVYESRSDERRSFHGMGPEITWNSSQPVWGDPANGEVSLDWGVNAAVLFGQQSEDIYHFSSVCDVEGYTGGNCQTGLPGKTTSSTVSRSRRVTVPNLGGYVGASVHYSNAKISFGYRADEFFGAMDGGQGTAKKYNRGFYGPFLNLSLGFGG